MMIKKILIGFRHTEVKSVAMIIKKLWRQKTVEQT